MGSISSLNNAERTPTALFSSAIAECWFLYRNLPLFLNHRVIASRIKLSSVIATDEDFKMKACVAACIAAGILWGVDVKLNDGRFSAVVQNVVVNSIPR